MNLEKYQKVQESIMKSEFTLQSAKKYQLRKSVLQNVSNEIISP